MQFNFDFVTKLLVGNITYLLLIISMMMTRMSMLRIVAIGSGVSGGIYDYFWLNDPVGTFWEATFTSVNVVQLALVGYANMLARFNDEERDFYTQFVAQLEPYQVRRILRTGVWLDAGPGTALACQGEIVSHLIFLTSGKCDVLVKDQSVGRCNAGSVIGEISFRSGKGATATVVAMEPVHYLALERNGLHKLVKADPEIAHAIENVSTQALEYKLVGMNTNQLCELMNMVPGAADLLQKMLVVLHVDPQEVAKTNPAVLRDLQRLCITCSNKKQCAHDLAQGTAAKHFHDYCPNAFTLDALFNPIGPPILR